MNRFSFNNEENFWPCVSDMFLAFFVIALALYANSNSEKGRGDEYISALARQEAIALMDSLHSVHAAHVQALSAAERDEPDKKNSPQLALRLYDLTRNDFICKEYFKNVHEHTPEYGPDGRSGDYNIRKAARLLYLCTLHLEPDCRQDDLKPVDDPEYHLHLRMVRERMERRRTPGDGMSKDENIAYLQKLLVEKMNEITHLKKWGGRLQEMLKKQGEDLDDANAANAALREEINKDNRKSVMEEVEKILNKEEYCALRVSGIELMKEEGVIRVPESVVGFDSAAWHPRSRNVGNINLLSDLMAEVAERVTRGSLKIDNISLECHADPRGTIIGEAEITLGKRPERLDIDNDWLSMMRAWAVWNAMEQRRGDAVRLATYKNKDGLGLFSTSGFGSRVPVPRFAGEDTDSYYSRCRRMDIRLNCSPEKTVPQTIGY